MTDGEVALERLQGRLVEDLGDQAHVLVDQDLAAVADRDAGRLLAAVLQGVEAEVGELGDVLAGRPDAEDAARVLGSAVLGVEVMGQAAVSATASPGVLWAGHGAECTCRRWEPEPASAGVADVRGSRGSRVPRHFSGGCRPPTHISRAPALIASRIRE